MGKTQGLGLLTKDEVAVLEVLRDHPKPRTQLTLALALRHRYPHLGEFFTSVEGLAKPHGNK